MQTIYEILESTPKKDTLTLRFKRPDLPGHIDEVFNVTEEQIRWLQYNIAKGNYPNGDVCIIDPLGKSHYFAKDGRLTSPVEGANTMRLNEALVMGLFTAPTGVPLDL